MREKLIEVGADLTLDEAVMKRSAEDPTGTCSTQQTQETGAQKVTQ